MAYRITGRRLGLAVGLALAVAVAFTPGVAVAMPFLIPIAVAAAFAASNIISWWAVAMIAVTMALSMAAQALFAKPEREMPIAQQASEAITIDQQQNVRQATSPIRVVYGEAMVGGVWAMQHTSDDNQRLYYSLMLAGHELSEVVSVRFEETTLVIDEEGVVTAQLDKDGNEVDSKYANNAVINRNLGADDQEADAYLVAEIPDIWTEAHRLRGIANLAGRLFWDNTTGDHSRGSKVWTGSFPTMTALCRGRLVYDPRTDEVAYSRNSALVVADYLTNTLFGRSVDYATGIDEELLIVAANICDETIMRADGEEEKRYTTDGSFWTDVQPNEILGKLLGAMHGKAIYDGVRWAIYAGAYQTPTLTLTDDDMRAPSRLSVLTPARDSFNAVKGTFISAENGYSPADFPAVVSDTFRILDGGYTSFKDAEMPFTNSPARAQRIAKIDLLRARQEIGEAFSGKLSCYRARAGTVIFRDSERWGWVQKPFEIQSMGFAAEGDPPALGINLQLFEIASNVYDWNTDEEQSADPAPNTNYPDVFNPGPPSPPFTATEFMYSTRDPGGVKVGVRFDYFESADAFVSRGGAYRIRYRQIGASYWVTLRDTTGLTIVAEDLPSGRYEAEAFGVNWAGNVSDTPLSIVFTVVGLPAAPAAPQNLNVVAFGGTVAHATWDYPTDLDVSNGGSVHFKFSPSLSATWDTATSISRALPGDTTETLLPLKAGRYLAKFQDGSGNWSTTAATFNCSQSSVLEFTSAGSSVESPTFAGTKANCVVIGGALQLAGAAMVDDIADWDSVTSVNYAGGVTPSGTYTAAAPLDLGSVQRVRVTSLIAAINENVFDSLDDRTGDVDDWPEFDGAMVGDESDVYTEMRMTNDNPSGAPVWSAWQRFHTVEVECRGIDYRARLISKDDSFTPIVSDFGILAESVV